MAKSKKKQGSGRYCAVHGCKNNNRKILAWKDSVCQIHFPEIHEECPCLQPYHLHRLPNGRSKDSAATLKQYLTNINRKDFKPTNDSRICSIHFIDGRPTVEHPYPVIQMGYDKPLCFDRPAPKLRETSSAINVPGNSQLTNQPTTEDASVQSYDASIADQIGPKMESLHEERRTIKTKKMSNRFSCAAINCLNEYKPGGCAFFRFPRDKQRCFQWLYNSGREDLCDESINSLYDNYRICADHFVPVMLWNSGKLVSNAIPTLFDVPSETKQTTRKRKESPQQNYYTENSDETENKSEEEELYEDQDSFTFPERPNFEEVGCIVPNCCNNVLHEYRKSKCLLYYPSSRNVDRTSAWHIILEDEFRDEISTIMSEEILSVCGRHFVDGYQSEEHPNPTLFGRNALSEDFEFVKKALRFCCIKNCRNGSDSWYPSAKKRSTNYYSLNLLCDDSVGRSLLNKLMSSTLYVGLENDTSFFCGLHFKVNILNARKVECVTAYQDEIEQESSSSDEDDGDMQVSKNIIGVMTNLVNNYDVVDDCCVIPTCPFSDILMKYRAGKAEFRPEMFAFPSINFHTHRRIEWLRLVRAAMPMNQKKFSPTLTSKICGCHFPNGSPTDDAPDPSLLTEYVEETKTIPDSTREFIINVSNQELSNITIAEPPHKRRRKSKAKGKTV